MKIDTDKDLFQWAYSNGIYKCEHSKDDFIEICADLAIKQYKAHVERTWGKDPLDFVYG